MLYLEKAEEPEIKLPKSVGSYKKQRNFLKIYFCFIDYGKAFDSVTHNKLWKNIKDMGIPDHLTYHLRNLYADQEKTEPNMENRLVQYWERSASRLYIVTLLI